MNWILFVMSALNFFQGINFIQYHGTTRKVTVTTRMTVQFVLGSTIGAVILYLAAWRLT